MLNRDTVTSDRKFDDSTVQQFNELRSLDLLLHQIQHCTCHSDNAGSNRRLRDGRKLARMQRGQFLPCLFRLRDLRGIDRSEVKINRWNGMIWQAVLGKIITAHRWIDYLDISVA